MPALHHSVFFTGRMPFLLPNQQRQSTTTTTALVNNSNELWFIISLILCVLSWFYGCMCTSLPFSCKCINKMIVITVGAWQHSWVGVMADRLTMAVQRHPWMKQPSMHCTSSVFTVILSITTTTTTILWLLSINAILLATSLSINTFEHKWVFEQSCCLAHLSVCLSVGQSVSRSVQWVNCWKTADWIWMSFGVVSGVGRGMGVLDGWRSSERKRQFWGMCGTSHCNQWRLCGIVILCHRGWRHCSSQITLGFLVFLCSRFLHYAILLPLRNTLCITECDVIHKASSI